MLIDDHEIIRAGLRKGLQSADDIAVICEAASGSEAVAAAEKFRPDIITIDIELPDVSGLDLIPRLRQILPDSSYIVLTMYPESEYLHKALSAGASAFLGKESSLIEIIATIRSIAINPRTFISPFVARSSNQRDKPTLTPQELRIISLLVDGATIKEISELLFISTATTKTHINHTYAKLGVKNRAQAVVAALRLGIVAP